MNTDTSADHLPIPTAILRSFWGNAFTTPPARNRAISALRMIGMNTTKLVIAFWACAFCCAVGQAAEKTVAEKTEEVWDKTKAKTKQVTKTVAKKTKETAKTVANKTKETANAIEHKIDTPDADARKVTVTITDAGVQMPASLRPGKTAFIVKNSGKERHNFEIQGGDLDKSFWFAIAPKDSKTMQVQLKPGSYEAHCNVEAHANKETRVKLVVK
jgi:hypothetical protein